MIKYDVFISYSRKDTAIADKIVKAFDVAGITYFIDRQGIGGGMEFPEVIANAILSSKVFLFLASKNSYDSKFTRSEVVFAFNEKQKQDVIPYIIDGSILPNDLRFTFSSINWRDMKQHPIEIIVTDVLQKVGRENKKNSFSVVERNKQYGSAMMLKKYLPWILSVIAVILVAILFLFFGKKEGDYGNSMADVLPNAVTDYDGNTYDAVRIGDQVWMAENLRTTHYANGEVIPSGGDGAITLTACHYAPNNDESTVSSYGYLYNWHAVMHGANSSDDNPSGVQGICPEGWHVPSDAEWKQLTDFVSSQSDYICGGQKDSIAKSLASATGWMSSSNDCAVGNNQSSNNSTAFSALPAGFYAVDYNLFGNVALFWSATEDDESSAFCCGLNNNYGGVDGANIIKLSGFSVRCVRD